MIRNIKKSISYLQSNPRVVFGLLVVFALLVSIQNISLGTKAFWGGEYTHYNNYVIYKNAFIHLLENRNLYDYYPIEYGDHFKYSPTFAIVMSFFYYLPDALGLFIWNALNMLVLCYAIYSIKIVDTNKKLFIVLFCMFGIILSTQNSQCNCLLAGLMILSFNGMEKGKNIQATFFIALAFYLKIYAVVGFPLLLLYPKKLKSILTLSVWILVLFLLPLLLIDFSELLVHYENWYDLLVTVHNDKIGPSIALFTQFVLPKNTFKLITLSFGALLLVRPLLQIQHFKNALFRLRFMAFLLVWMVVFNYNAESPTYIIAMVGIGIWFFSYEQSKWNTILVIMCLFFTSVYFTDIIPRFVKDNFIDLKFVKSFFPVLLLFKIYLSLTMDNKSSV